MRFGSLFSGIGGLDLGFERAGWECRWQVEIDPFCQETLRRHWPDVPKFTDVRGVSSSSLEAVDAICGGFPCQPVSNAGERQAQSDDRWLWPEFARLVGEMGPRFVIVENVPGLWTTENAGSEVISDLASLGYDIRWDRLSASAVGAPHIRERVFIVAYSNQPRLEGPKPTQRRVLPPGSGFGSPVAYSDSERWSGRSRSAWERGWGEFADGSFREQWRRDPAEVPESGVGRVAYGVPGRVDRLRGLGNAVVPQVAESIARWIEHVFEGEV